MNVWTRRRILMTGLILVILIGGGWWLRAPAASSIGSNASSGLEATGTIEDRKATLGSQIGGQVTDVLVEEGQPVRAGQTLVKLDDSLLLAQREIAKANLAAAESAVQTAQAQYDNVLTAARAQEGPTRISDWAGRTPDYFDQPNWYFARAEQIVSAQAAVAAAEADLTAAEDNLDAVIGDIRNSGFVEAEKRLSDARMKYLVARQVQAEGQAVGQGKSPDQLDLKSLRIQVPCLQTAQGNVCAPGYAVRIRVSQNLPDQQALHDASQTAYDAAETELSAAQAAYNKLLTSASAQRVLKARAEVAVAKERSEVAQDKLNALQTGELSPQVAAASAALEQAKNAAQQAQANLDLLDVQLKKLTLTAPENGVVLTRSAEVGQIALPGATLIEIGRLDQLELTVYLPEEQFGLVKPGQAVQARVDAYPDRVFQGTVLRMSNEAEFTPTNVQTKEDRTRLVYAVVIRLDNPDLALKPGMIADVTFPMGASQ